MPIQTPLVIYVDIDDTLIRSVGSTRIPMPAPIAHIRLLKEQGAELYCWSSGGAAYARQSAEEVGIADCFNAFLPKPHVILDDQPLAEWRRLLEVHPNQCAGAGVESYRQQLAPRQD
jgi:hypothetical protein